MTIYHLERIKNLQLDDTKSKNRLGCTSSREMFKDILMREGDRERMRGEKSLAHYGIQTHDLLIMRHSLLLSYNRSPNF